MLKVYNKNTGACFTPFSSVSVVDIEQVNVSWVKYINFKILAKCVEWKDEAQISVMPHDKTCLFYILKMKKYPSFSSICLKLAEKWYFTYTNLQFKEPAGTFYQNSQVKMTVIKFLKFKTSFSLKTWRLVLSRNKVDCWYLQMFISRLKDKH